MALKSFYIELGPLWGDLGAGDFVMDVWDLAGNQITPMAGGTDWDWAQTAQGMYYAVFQDVPEEGIAYHLHDNPNAPGCWKYGVQDDRGKTVAASDLIVGLFKRMFSQYVSPYALYNGIVSIEWVGDPWDENARVRFDLVRPELFNGALEDRWAYGGIAKLKWDTINGGVILDPDFTPDNDTFQPGDVLGICDNPGPIPAGTLTLHCHGRLVGDTTTIRAIFNGATNYQCCFIRRDGALDFHETYGSAYDLPIKYANLDAPVSSAVSFTQDDVEQMRYQLRLTSGDTQNPGEGAQGRMPTTDELENLLGPVAGYGKRIRCDGSAGITDVSYSGAETDLVIEFYAALTPADDIKVGQWSSVSGWEPEVGVTAVWFSMLLLSHTAGTFVAGGTLSFKTVGGTEGPYNIVIPATGIPGGGVAYPGADGNWYGYGGEPLTMLSGPDVSSVY